MLINNLNTDIIILQNIMEFFNEIGFELELIFHLY